MLSCIEGKYFFILDMMFYILPRILALGISYMSDGNKSTKPGFATLQYSTSSNKRMKKSLQQNKHFFLLTLLDKIKNIFLKNILVLPATDI